MKILKSPTVDEHCEIRLCGRWKEGIEVGKMEPSKNLNRTDPLTSKWPDKAILFLANLIYQGFI